MNEILVGIFKIKGKYEDAYSYDMDYVGKADGTFVSTDKSANNITVGVLGNMGSPRRAGVEQHPTAGPCFHFNGNGGFWNTNMQALANFSAGSFDIEIGFVKTSDKSCFLFTTGNNTNGYNDRGMSVMINGTDIDTIEYHMNNPGVGVSKVILAGIQTNVLQEIVVKKRKTDVEIINITTGASIKDTPTIRNASDVYIAIGTRKGGGSVFDGFLKYVRIRKFIE